MCAGGNGDRGQPGERCVSTTNRNFEHRQGPKVRTHLVSPETAAATAVTGRIADVRQLMAALASEASGQRGDSEVRAPDTRLEPGSSARAGHA